MREGEKICFDYKIAKIYALGVEKKKSNFPKKLFFVHVVTSYLAKGGNYVTNKLLVDILSY